MVKICLWARSSQEDTIIAVVIRAAVSADGAGSIRSQGEAEDICVLELVEVKVEVDLFLPFLGPRPPSSTVPLNPSGFQEKDQNLKYIFHFIDS